MTTKRTLSTPFLRQTLILFKNSSSPNQAMVPSSLSTHTVKAQVLHIGTLRVDTSCQPVMTISSAVRDRSVTFPLLANMGLMSLLVWNLGTWLGAPPKIAHPDHKISHNTQTVRVFGIFPVTVVASSSSYTSGSLGHYSKGAMVTKPRCFSVLHSACHQRCLRASLIHFLIGWKHEPHPECICL